MKTTNPFLRLRAGSKAGVALLLVISALALLLLLAVTFSTLMRTEYLAASTYARGASLRGLTGAAISQAVEDIEFGSRTKVVSPWGVTRSVNSGGYAPTNVDEPSSSSALQHMASQLQPPFGDHEEEEYNDYVPGQFVANLRSETMGSAVDWIPLHSEMNSAIPSADTNVVGRYCYFAYNATGLLDINQVFTNYSIVSTVYKSPLDALDEFQTNSLIYFAESFAERFSTLAHLPPRIELFPEISESLGARVRKEWLADTGTSSPPPSYDPNLSMPYRPTGVAYSAPPSLIYLYNTPYRKNGTDRPRNLWHHSLEPSLGKRASGAAMTIQDITEDDDVAVLAQQKFFNLNIDEILVNPTPGGIGVSPEAGAMRDIFKGMGIPDIPLDSSVPSTLSPYNYTPVDVLMAGWQDYIDSDEEPSAVYYSTERHPMFSELQWEFRGHKSTPDGTGTAHDHEFEIVFDYEVMYPWAKEWATGNGYTQDIEFDVTVEFKDSSVPPKPDESHTRTFTWGTGGGAFNTNRKAASAGNDPGISIRNKVEEFEIKNSQISEANLSKLSVTIDIKTMNISYPNGGGLTVADTVTAVGAKPTMDVIGGTGPSKTKLIYEVNDPRFNANLNHNRFWREANSTTLGKLNNFTMYELAYERTDQMRDGAGVYEIFMHAGDEKFQHVGELGWLAYAPWKTLRTFRYRNGTPFSTDHPAPLLPTSPNPYPTSPQPTDTGNPMQEGPPFPVFHNVWDYFEVDSSNTVHRGMININTAQPDVLKFALRNRPIDVYPGAAHNVAGSVLDPRLVTIPKATVFVDEFIAAPVAADFVHRGDVMTDVSSFFDYTTIPTPTAPTIPPATFAPSVPGGASFRGQTFYQEWQAESIVRNFMSQLGTRDNNYGLFVIAQSGFVDGGSFFPTGTEKTYSTFWRDGWPSPGRGGAHDTLIKATKVIRF